MKIFTFWGLPLLLLALLLPGLAQAQCATPTSARSTGATSSTATVAFNLVLTATSYTVTYTAPGGSPQTVMPNPTASPVVLTGLLPLTNYAVSIAANCSGGSSAPATFTALTLIGNDEPCGAVPLPLSGATCQYTSGDAFLASPTTPNGYSVDGCGSSVNSRDVWFTFTTASTGPASTGATLSVLTPTGGELRLFSAASCAGPFTEISCVANPQFSSVVPPLAVAGLLPATTYYVRICAGFPDGTFRVCVRDPPACGDPINVSIAPVLATSAQLNFRPGFNNSSFTVTYRPTAGGATTTVTPAPGASPVLFSSLTPLTAYTVTLQANCTGGGTGTVITRTFTTPPINDEPSGALPLPLLPTCQYTAGTTKSATRVRINGAFLPECNVNYGDVWYTLTTDATGPGSRGATLSVGTGGRTSATELALFSSAAGAAGPFTQVGCSVTNNVMNPVPPLLLFGLSPSTTYYVRVSTISQSAGYAGPFTLCATFPPACPAPTGLSVSAGATSTSAFVAWTITTPGDTYTVEYGTSGFVPGTGQTVTGIVGSSTVINNLTLGVYYQFYVTRDCSAAGNGSSTRLGPGNLLVAFPSPVNDEPCGAITLTSGGANCVPTNGTLDRATQTTPNGYVAISCGSRVTRRADVWYNFRTAASGPGSTSIATLVSGVSAGYVRVFSASSCNGPFTEIACAAEPTGNQQAPPLVISSGLTPNTLYYIMVSQNPITSNGLFTICLTDPPACANPTNVQLGNFSPSGSTLTVPLTFVPAAGTTGYAITYTAQGGAAQTISPVPTGSPVVLPGLVPSSNYTVTLQSTCGGGVGSPITLPFTTPPLPPVNDMCAGALPIVCGQNIIVSTATATTVGDPSGTCNRTNLNAPAVFYRFVGTGDDVVVSMCNPGTNSLSTILVYSGSCSNLSCVGGSDYDLACTLNTNFSTVPFRSTAGTVYYIIISGYNYSETGPFDLSLRCLPRGCVAPAAVVASAVTTTTASVGFTPANATATSYTATATPTTGGPARTATGPASPLALTGLAPNTPYSVCVTANCPAGVSSACSTPAVLLRTLLGSRSASLAAQVELFPNPAHHRATLRVPAALARQAVTVSLYGALGQRLRQLVLAATATDTETTLDLTGLPAGVYTLRLTTAQGPLVKRLVLQ